MPVHVLPQETLVGQSYTGQDYTGNRWVLSDRIFSVVDLDILASILVWEIIGNGWKRSSMRLMNK
jgi:hypothetical protein